MASIPIIKQTDATKELQFKLYASKFPVWWTHNSVDKPDPTYFDHLNDEENTDGFNWIEVPFTFNFKDQFTGSLVVDDQYYTFFKLVDSKDETFPNKYYLVEDLRKAFNGGYELEVRLDVFTTYGLDFWVTGVNNPDINTKNVTLNRTNHSGILLKNYYNYDAGVDNYDFNNWSYFDPLLQFESLADVSLVASAFGWQLRQDETGKYYKLWYLPYTYITQVYNYTWNGSGWDTSTTALFDSYVINGNSGANYNSMMFSSIRYYVFKPLIGEDDQYWAIWSLAPRSWGTYPKNTMRAYSNNAQKPSFNFCVSANDVNTYFIHSDKGFANKLVGVFEGPPLSFIGNTGFSPNVSDPSTGDLPYMIETCGLNINNEATFLVSKIYITPDRLSGNAIPPSSPTRNNLYFSILNILNPGSDALDSSLTTRLISSDNEIRFISNENDGSTYRLLNNLYVLQKCKIANLQFTPFYPSGIYVNTNMKWEPALQSSGMPTMELAQIRVPDTIFFTSSGFRFGYISKFLSIGITLWLLPTSLPVGTDAYAQYMASVLINQNNSMAIAKQQMEMGVADSVFKGITGMFTGDIVGGISSAFNMSMGVSKSVLAYQNQQKTYDAQNATARATMSTSINNTVDADTAQQINTTGLYRRFRPAEWATVWSRSCNWLISAKIPTLPRDIKHYNNIIYLNGFFVDCQIKIADLVIDWNNGNGGYLPHIYYDFNITSDIIKYHYKTVNIELLNAITVLFNNGIRFWAGFPDYSKPWYWIPYSADTIPNTTANAKNLEYTNQKPLNISAKPTIVPIKQETSNPVQNAPYNNPADKPTYGYGSNMNAK